MSEVTKKPKLITDTNVTEFFRECVEDAAHNQNVEAAPDTLHYIVSLLANFTRSSELFTPKNGDSALKPLAEIYLESLQSESRLQRDVALRRLGDIALFIAGTFSAYITRKGLSPDYYVSMGGSAYGSLADDPQSQTLSALQGTFGELSEKFDRFVDVVAEVHESGRVTDDKSLVANYGRWLNSGDKRAEMALRKAGIFPILVDDGVTH